MSEGIFKHPIIRCPECGNRCEMEPCVTMATYDALQKENERLTAENEKRRAIINNDFECQPDCDSYGHSDKCMSVYFDQQLIAWKDRAERAERELVERGKDIDTLTNHLESVKAELAEAEEAIRAATELFRVASSEEEGKWYEMPAVKRAVEEKR